MNMYKKPPTHIRRQLRAGEFGPSRPLKGGSDRNVGVFCIWNMNYLRLAKRIFFLFPWASFFLIWNQETKNYKWSKLYYFFKNQLSPQQVSYTRELHWSSRQFYLILLTLSFAKWKHEKNDKIRHRINQLLLRVICQTGGEGGEPFSWIYDLDDLSLCHLSRLCDVVIQLKDCFISV